MVVTDDGLEMRGDERDECDVINVHRWLPGLEVRGCQSTRVAW